MPPTVTMDASVPPAPPDELDRLLDYDNAVEDFLRDIPIGQGDQGNTTSAEKPAVDDDQEVQVKRKRRPNPKLDENRLLSEQGIPKLRKITKTRLKLRRKGHEFADISRLLNTYQLWLDDLYPRAKFRDALAMVEKVGHSKRMQVMRKAWLDETKPGRQNGSPDVEMSGALAVQEDGHDAANGAETSAEDLFQQMLRDEPSREDNTQKAPENDAPDDDELDALLAENGRDSGAQSQRQKPQRTGPFEEDETDEDERNALLAESNQNDLSLQTKEPSGTSTLQQGAPEEDDLEALLAEQPTAAQRHHNSSETTSGERAKTTERDGYDDFADEEEVMASMGW